MARTWYIEARVGSENYRGDLVHFIDDRRGTDGEYINMPAEKKMAELMHDVEMLRESLRIAQNDANDYKKWWHRAQAKLTEPTCDKCNHALCSHKPPEGEKDWSCEECDCDAFYWPQPKGTLRQCAKCFDDDNFHCTHLEGT